MIYPRQRVAHICLEASIPPVLTNTKPEIKDVQVFRAWSLTSKFKMARKLEVSMKTQMITENITEEVVNYFGFEDEF